MHCKKRSNWNRRWLAGLLLACGNGTWAADALPAITVTSNKQSQSLMRVPASLSVLGADELENAGIQDLGALSVQIPGLSFQPSGQSTLQPPVMRGVSASVIGFSSSTLLVVDGVPTMMAQGFDHNLLGVERVEVLRGPQSTLYGRNAEAGVISISTRQPGNDRYATLSGETGSRSLAVARVDAGAPLLRDTLYLGVAGEWRSQDGFVSNRYLGGREDDRERKNGRFVLRWTPTSATDVALRYGITDYNDGGSTWGLARAARGTVRSGTPGRNRSKAQTGALDVGHAFGNGLRLRSVTARNVFNDRALQDTDFNPPQLFAIERDHRFDTVSQEFRLEGRLGAAHWLAGIYADRDDYRLDFRQTVRGRASGILADQKGHTEAVFTDWTVPLSDRWTLTAGARAERSVTDYRPRTGTTASRTDAHVSPRLALGFQWRPEVLFYASMADGYRAGGYNAFAEPGQRNYEPEKLHAYEMGAKGIVADGRLRYGVALYLMTLDDMQVQQMRRPGQPYISNAASARSTGLDGELHYRLGGGWSMTGVLALNRTRFRQFRDGAVSHDGNRNPFAPDISGSLGLRYESAGGWHAQADVNGSGRVYLDAANSGSRRRAGYGLANLQAGARLGALDLVAYVRNLADRPYDAVGFLNGTATVYSPPRELGVRLTYRM